MHRTWIRSCVGLTCLAWGMAACTPSPGASPAAAAEPAPTAAGNTERPEPSGSPAGELASDAPPPEPAPPPPPAQLVFTHDDYEAALERAGENGKLLFVDVWAEWCHTCLSMDSYVLNDPSLRDFTDQYEFVALDSEKPRNEAFLQRYAVDTWPTYFVIAPRDQQLIGYWPGAGSVREMRDFLQSSVDAAAALSEGSAPAYLRDFLEARRAQSLGDYEAARSAFERAHRAAPPDWSRKSELLLGYVRVLLRLQRFDECAALGKRHLDEVRGAARPAQFAQRYFTCLGQLRTPSRQTEMDRALEKLRGEAYQPGPDVSFDDQVDALLMLANAYQTVGNVDLARAATQKRLEIAEAAAERAENEHQARTFDRVRAFAYLDQGRGAEAIRMLEARERELVHSYAVPELLADVYHRLGRTQEAIEALERAIAHASGPRQARFLERQASWLENSSDVEGRLRALDRAISVRKTLRGAENQAQLARTQALRDQLARRGATP